MPLVLSGTTTLRQSGPGSNGNEGVLHIPQSPSITGTSPSDCLVSYQDTHVGGLTPLLRCSWCILRPQPTEQTTLGQCLFGSNGNEGVQHTPKITRTGDAVQYHTQQTPFLFREGLIVSKYNEFHTLPKGHISS